MNVVSLLQGLDEAHIRYVLVGGFALQLSRVTNPDGLFRAVGQIA